MSKHGEEKNLQDETNLLAEAVRLRKQEERVTAKLNENGDLMEALDTLDTNEIRRVLILALVDKLKLPDNTTENPPENKAEEEREYRLSYSETTRAKSPDEAKTFFRQRLAVIASSEDAFQAYTDLTDEETGDEY